eukprot:Tamp_06213.p1 GENE.Tamp_06213~~Tamp_06213.p1  ORF type:complete len:836 (+),score=216.15 Tamp_06213:102-2510(+)
MGASLKPKEVGENTFLREDIPKNVKRVIIKVGTSVLTRDQEFGVSLTRLASLVEQVSALVHMGKEVIIVTSGAVGFGKMKLQVQTVMSQTVRNTLSWGSNASPPSLDSRACAAAGQSGLMTLYDAMFSQYGVSIAQILVTMSDFQVDAHRANMCETIKELLSLGIVPICNENDVFYSNTESREFMMSHKNTVIGTFNPNFKNAINRSDIEPELGAEEEWKLNKVVRLTANDSLTALLAVQLDAQLMVMLSDVDGIYTAPPGRSFDMGGSSPKLLHTFNPDDPEMEMIEYGRDQRVGRGGMAAKVESAKFALNHGVHCILCNGHHQDALQKIFEGRSVGTLFTRMAEDQAAPHVRAMDARAASRELVMKPASDRRALLETLAKKISKNLELILSANQDDLNVLASQSEKEVHPGAQKQAEHHARSVQLTKRKIKALSAAVEAIALQASHAVGKNTRWLKVADGLYLEQEAVPMGVALCVFDDTSPDVVAQVAAMCLASGNAVLLKGTERSGQKTMSVIHGLFTEALKEHKVSKHACTLINQREAFEDYLSLEGHIDIVIPRGGRELLQFVNTSTKIPVLGDSEAMCHVYVHKDADLAMAANIIFDSKCSYTGFGQYALQNILVHASIVEQGGLEELLSPLISNGVTVFAGPRLRAQFRTQTLKMPAARSLNMEWDQFACAVEVVETLDDAVSHINLHGSHHTDVIVTADDLQARLFNKGVESACVFHNCSIRFSDSYAFGLGQQVGMETKRNAIRGPVGIDGLMTSKWLLKGKGHVTETLGEARGSNWVLQKKCVTCGMDVSS